MFKIANSKLQTLVVAEFSCGGYERANFNDYHHHDGKYDSKSALVLAKGLFHLGYLTPKIEVGLKVNISHHEKMEWQMAFENGVRG